MVTICGCVLQIAVHITDAQHSMPEIDDDDDDVEDDDLIIFPLTDLNGDSDNSSEAERYACCTSCSEYK